jgi:hypothetical protein
MGRVLVSFSCGAASAVAAKLAVEEYGNVDVIYCDTFAHEHPDNRRFFDDVQAWLGREITVLKSEQYGDIFDVFAKTGWLVGPAGARCTTELKKKVRQKFQRVDDIHVLGFTSEEAKRRDRFQANNPELLTDFILIRKGVTKAMCKRMLTDAGIALPAMYLLGYKNNNCIGCVKGQSGYWNKIRVDFPAAFDRMAATERTMGVACNKKYVKGVRIPVFLDELDPKAGRYASEPDLSCGVWCGQQ